MFVTNEKQKFFYMFIDNMGPVAEKPFRICEEYWNCQFSDSANRKKRSFVSSFIVCGEQTFIIIGHF